MTVWKFTLAAMDEQIIEWPTINRPLSIQIQHGQPCLWSLVDPDSPRIRVKLRTFGTGHEGIPSGMDYVGSYQISGGMLVFHVFIEGIAC